MQKSLVTTLFLLFLLRGGISAQNIYQSIGKKSEMLTLSNGTYVEFFPNDTIVRIGTVLLNTVTKEIVDFVEVQEDTTTLTEEEMSSRFLSLDPITRNYPELTPYQFASNTPIMAIDLDGLEAFVIHGTNETHPRFSTESYNQFKRITGNSYVDASFSWGPLAVTTNSRDVQRKQAANDLVAHIVKTRAALLKNKIIGKNEPISLVGYSHGGNVAIQAAKILYDKYKIKVNLLTVSTPAYNAEKEELNIDREIVPNPVYIKNSESPTSNDGINAHTHIIHEKDGVVTVAGGNHAFEGSAKHEVKNILITEKELSIPYNDKTDASVERPAWSRYHTKLPVAVGVDKVLEKIPIMKPAPIPIKLNNN